MDLHAKIGGPDAPYKKRMFAKWDRQAGEQMQAALEKAFRRKNMAVIAKLRCASVEDFGGTSKKVNLGAVYPTDAERETQGENATFNNATPYAELKMSIDNPHAAVQFEPGRDYYCVFYPAEIGMAAALNGGVEPS